MSVSATATRPRTATLLAQALSPFLPPGPMPVRLKAWDGSEAGPRDAPVVVVRNPRALRRPLWQPGGTGLAEAYIAGETDTEDDLATSLGHVRQNLAPAYTLADAQHAKHELICRKLGLGPGMRLLGIGCGWGALALHAARHHQVRVTAVTLSAEQAHYARARAVRERLGGLVEVALGHYRDIGDAGFDAVTAIEMGEHVGEGAYPDFAALLHRMLRPRGRLSIRQLSRGATAPGGGSFIETCIAPDTHMRPVGRTVSLLESAGLEVRSVESLREHYAQTLAAWSLTLEERRKEFVTPVGEPTTRAWRLYLAGSRPAFAQNRTGVDQILAARPDGRGGAAVHGTPAHWYTKGPLA